MPEVLARGLQARGQLAAAQHDEDGARRCLEEAVLITEEQAIRFTQRTDAVQYRQQRKSALRELFRAAVWRDDVEAAFRYQELDRGRLLLDLWRGAAGTGALVA